MSQTPESKIKAAIIRKLHELKRQGFPIWWMHNPGGPQSKRGIPDLLVVAAGNAIFLEVKCPGKRMTKLQARRCEEIVTAFGYAGMVTSAEQVEAIVIAHFDQMVACHEALILRQNLDNKAAQRAACGVRRIC